jgi:hypothetical protein
MTIMGSHPGRRAGRPWGRAIHLLPERSAPAEA